MAAPDNSTFALRQLLEEVGAQLRSGVEKLGDLPHETGDVIARELGLATREELEAMPLAPPAATGLGEVVRRRYLLRMLVRNTIQSRYQGTVLGWLWSYLQPAIRFCLFYFLFQVMIGRGAGMENFAVHLFAGMVMLGLPTPCSATSTSGWTSSTATSASVPASGWTSWASSSSSCRP